MLFHSKKSIVDSYEKYLINADVDSQNEFLWACFSYDFLSYESDMEKIKSLYRSSRIECEEEVLLWSNGSTGKECSYLVGPHGGNLIDKIESFQRGCSMQELFKISTYYPNRRGFNEVIDEGYLVVDLSSPECTEFIVNFLNQNPDKRCLESSPNVFMMICCHEELLRSLSERSISVITTGDEAYSHKDFKSRNRMIDWKTGCNFYECKYGNRHILPIWFEEKDMSYNILNLSNKNGNVISDLVEIKGFFDCSCGGKICEFNITSHFKNKPWVEGRYLTHKEVMSHMKGKYLNFQLLFSGNSVRLLVDEFGDHDKFEEDYGLAKSMFEKMGFAMSLELGSFAYLGRRKRPLIWMGEKNLVVEKSRPARRTLYG